jgi:hypothetical protein
MWSHESHVRNNKSGNNHRIEETKSVFLGHCLIAGEVPNKLISPD